MDVCVDLSLAMCGGRGPDRHEGKDQALDQGSPLALTFRRREDPRPSPGNVNGRRDLRGVRHGAPKASSESRLGRRDWSNYGFGRDLKELGVVSIADQGVDDCLGISVLIS